MLIPSEIRNLISDGLFVTYSVRNTKIFCNFSTKMSVYSDGLVHHIFHQKRHYFFNSGGRRELSSYISFKFSVIMSVNNSIRQY